MEALPSVPLGTVLGFLGCADLVRLSAASSRLRRRLTNALWTSLSSVELRQHLDEEGRIVSDFWLGGENRRLHGRLSQWDERGGVGQAFACLQNLCGGFSHVRLRLSSFRDPEAILTALAEGNGRELRELRFTQHCLAKAGWLEPLERLVEAEKESLESVGLVLSKDALLAIGAQLATSLATAASLRTTLLNRELLSEMREFPAGSTMYPVVLGEEKEGAGWSQALLFDPQGHVLCDANDLIRNFRHIVLDLLITRSYHDSPSPEMMGNAMAELVKGSPGLELLHLHAGLTTAVAEDVAGRWLRSQAAEGRTERTLTVCVHKLYLPNSRCPFQAAAESDEEKAGERWLTTKDFPFLGRAGFRVLHRRLPSWERLECDRLAASHVHDAPTPQRSLAFDDPAGENTVHFLCT